MNLDAILPRELEGSSLEPELRALHALYERVDEAISAFQREASAHLEASGGHFGCLSGCGGCCERFIPAPLPVEADYAALWIMRFRPDLATRQESAAPGQCPYYDADRPGENCSIYGGRALICRLFGLTATLSKEGLPTYSLCWKMENLPGLEERNWTGKRLEEVLGGIPPVMSTFGFALESIAPAAPGPRLSIEEAIAEAIDRIRFRISLAAGDTP